MTFKISLFKGVTSIWILIFLYWIIYFIIIIIKILNSNDWWVLDEIQSVKIVLESFHNLPLFYVA